MLEVADKSVLVRCIKISLVKSVYSAVPGTSI